MIAVMADGDSDVGMGHMMRCISIAKQLVKQGEEVIFLLIESSNTSILEYNQLSYMQLGSEDESRYAKAKEWMRRHDCRKILVDSYRITPLDFDLLSQEGKVVYIDDLYAFDYKCTVIINYNIEASYGCYSNSLNKRQLFLGTKYFPLRDEFCSIYNHIVNETVKRVLITTGSTDNYAMAFNILSILAEEYKQIEFSVLIGLFYTRSYVDRLIGLHEKYGNVSIVRWRNDIASVIVNCDLVIAPGSTIIFEALSVNVPCISYEFASNHHNQCAIMDQHSIAPFIGNITVFNNEIQNKLREIFREEIVYERRKEREAKYGKYFDKKGSQRISDIIRRI